MDQRTRADVSYFTQIYKYELDNKQLISGSSYRIWENRKPYWDTPGSQHSNHVLIGKEDGSILLNFQLYSAHPMQQKRSTHTDYRDTDTDHKNDISLDG